MTWEPDSSHKYWHEPQGGSCILTKDSTKTLYCNTGEGCDININCASFWQTWCPLSDIAVAQSEDERSEPLNFFFALYFHCLSQLALHFVHLPVFGRQSHTRSVQAEWNSETSLKTYLSANQLLCRGAVTLTKFSSTGQSQSKTEARSVILWSLVTAAARRHVEMSQKWGNSYNAMPSCSINRRWWEASKGRWREMSSK